VSPVNFRNVDVDPSTSPDTWPMEAIETVIDRGSLHDWRRLTAAARANPWGPAARAVQEIASWEDHGGVARLLGHVVDAERRRLTAAGRRRHADHLRSLRTATGRSLRDFAPLVGTSAQRLSAYENAKVSPTTDVVGRIEAVAARLSQPPEPQAEE
jgi:DNA-binding transcriptional regulator YiaG